MSGDAMEDRVWVWSMEYCCLINVIKHDIYQGRHGIVTRAFVTPGENRLRHKPIAVEIILDYLLQNGSETYQGLSDSLDMTLSAVYNAIHHRKDLFIIRRTQDRNRKVISLRNNAVKPVSE